MLRVDKNVEHKNDGQLELQGIELQDMELQNSKVMV